MWRAAILTLFWGWSTHLLAQDHWARDLDGAAPGQLVDVQVDADGNIYSIGDFSNSVLLDGWLLTAAGARDVMVMKMDAAGTVIWMKRAGGPGFDIGLKLALGANGVLAITGTFTGTADLFGQTFTSSGGTTDLFVALLNAGDGSAQWVRIGGSDAFVDTPGAITIPPNGNVVVAGRFKGSAVFDAGTLTSPIDPWTQEHGFDVFMASYSSSGTPQWLQHGSGSHDEEAVEIATDAQSNLYLTGAYSDTITFDQWHPNIALNSIYLVKFNAAGEEQWFRKCGGTIYNHVTDMRMGTDGNLLLCGDVQGDMQWVDQVPIVLPSAYDQAYFILRVDPGGTLLGHADMGSVNEVRSASITEQADSVVVYGTFVCDFTGLQDAYTANGLFIATGTRDLFVSKHARSDLSFIKAQQFGGGGEKRAGQVEPAPDQGLIFCGSYSRSVVFPSDGGTWGESDVCSWSEPASPNGYCGDPHYHEYTGLYSDFLIEGFIGRCLVDARQPYDFWARNGQPPCYRPDRSDGLCILEWGGSGCPDTLEVCSSVLLIVISPIYIPGGPCLGGPSVAPAMDAAWCGTYPGGSHSVNQTGWHYFEITTANGCRHLLDSIYVIVHEPPEALFSESSGVYVEQEPNVPCTMWDVCDSLWFWDPLYDPTDIVTWQLEGQPVVYNDSIFATVDGEYILTVTDTNGCSTTNHVCPTFVSTGMLPEITNMDFTFVYGNDTLSGNDTIRVCGPGCIGGVTLLTWYENGVPVQPPEFAEVLYEFVGPCPPPTMVLNGVPFIPWHLNVPATAGWFTIIDSVHFGNLPCGTVDYNYGGSVNVYVIPGPPPEIEMPEAIPACVGDTVLITLACEDCDGFAWEPSPGIIWISAGNDSIRVNAFGAYTANAYRIIAGDSCTTSAECVVFNIEPPWIFIDPDHGVICPNDSALVYTTGWPSGTGYDWLGPGGLITTDNDSIWVTEPGDYYLTVNTGSDCSVSNGPVTLTEFSSPFIQALPSNVICLDGSVLLQVVAGPGAVLAWQAPLSGDDPEQVVSQAGTYTCIVTSCEVDWVLSIDVLASGVAAEISGGPFIICDSVPILLSGPDGASQYLWLPDTLSTQQIEVSQPGEYQLIVFDGSGCSDSSAVFTVSSGSIEEPLIAFGDTACAGSMATLTAIGSGSIAWFMDTTQTAFAATDLVTLGPVTTSGTYYALQNDGGCESAFVPVELVVLPGAPSPVISGDTLLCAGDELLLSVQPAPGITYIWMTPQGWSSGPQYAVPFASIVDGGSYYVVGYSDALCASDTAHIVVAVTALPATPVIAGDTALCAGEVLMLNVAVQVGAVVHWNTPGGPFTGTPLQVEPVALADAGMYSAWIEVQGCSGAGSAVRVIVADPPPTPGIDADTLYCIGDEVQLNALLPAGTNAVWDLPNGGTADDPLNFIAQATGNGTYTVIVEGDPCPDALASITLTIDDCELEVPNVITPNGDGDNDVLLIEGPLGSMLEIRIYNRWGQLMAELSGNVIRWNGTRSSNNERVPDGVYYYVLEASTQRGQESLTGYVHVLH